MVKEIGEDKTYDMIETTCSNMGAVQGKMSKSQARRDKIKEMNLPGNIRELDNLLTRILFQSSGSIISEKVLADINIQEPAISNGDPRGPGLNKVQPLWEVEKEMIEKALEVFPNNLSKIANELEISRSSLYRKLKKYGLQD